jgi:hypothetical protein
MVVDPLERHGGRDQSCGSKKAPRVPILQKGPATSKEPPLAVSLYALIGHRGEGAVADQGAENKGVPDGILRI